jgi:hypothetical protein
MVAEGYWYSIRRDDNSGSQLDRDEFGFGTREPVPTKIILLFLLAVLSTTTRTVLRERRVGPSSLRNYGLQSSFFIPELAFSPYQERGECNAHGVSSRLKSLQVD